MKKRPTTSPMKGSPVKITETLRTSIVTRTSFADAFLDQRERAALQIELKSTQVSLEDVSNTLVSLNLKFVNQRDL